MQLSVDWLQIIAIHCRSVKSISIRIYAFNLIRIRIVQWFSVKCFYAVHSFFMDERILICFRLFSHSLSFSTLSLSLSPCALNGTLMLLLSPKKAVKPWLRSPINVHASNYIQICINNESPPELWTDKELFRLEWKLSLLPVSTPVFFSTISLGVSHIVECKVWHKHNKWMKFNFFFYWFSIKMKVYFLIQLPLLFFFLPFGLKHHWPIYFIMYTGWNAGKWFTR